MLRTIIGISVTVLLVGFVVWAARGPASANASSNAALACPCGQCDEGCTCCVSEEVSCENCQCEKCGCEGCVSPDAEKSCCAAKAACCADSAGTGAVADGDQAAVTCCDGCEAGCNCCSSDDVACEACICEACECEVCNADAA